jgi:hypothetical protein
MMAIMGAPPKELLQSSEYVMKFFDSDGMIMHTPSFFSVTQRGRN